MVEKLSLITGSGCISTTRRGPRCCMVEKLSLITGSGCISTTRRGLRGIVLVATVREDLLIGYRTRCLRDIFG